MWLLWLNGRISTFYSALLWHHQYFFKVNLTFEMLTVHGQQHSFSTHEQMFLWKCQSFCDRKCLDLRGTRTPNLFLTYCDIHDDVIKWKHFPRCWPFVQGIHWSLVNSPHKGQWHGALMFSLICVCINGWVNNFEAGDLRRHCAHYDVIVMSSIHEPATSNCDVTMTNCPHLISMDAFLWQRHWLVI